MVRLAPSLLSADFGSLQSEIADIVAAGADLLHLDIMDGHFVPNLTFGPMVVRAIAETTPIPLDAHLMVTDPDPLIEELGALGVARIAVHVESCRHLHRSLNRIRDLGAESGIAINPATSLSLIEEALHWSDFVMLMSVNPGFGGQAFIPESTAKLRQLRAMIGDRSIDVSVDGGVGVDTIGELAAAGAHTLIAGSAIFGAHNRHDAIQQLRDAAKISHKGHSE